MKSTLICLFSFLTAVGASAADKTARVCLFRDQRSTCREYAYDCNFKSSELTQDMNKTNRLWNNDLKLGRTDILNPTDFPKYFVKQSTFGVMTGTTPMLYTTGLWPCGAVALLNPRCEYASLSHYDMNDPKWLVPQMAKDLKQTGQCQTKDTSVYILTSNILFENFSREPHNLYFRRIVCGAREQFPTSKIFVYFSTKTQADSDSIWIKKISGGYLLTLTTESGELKQSVRYTNDSVQNLP